MSCVIQSSFGLSQFGKFGKFLFLFLYYPRSVGTNHAATADTNFLISLCGTFIVSQRSLAGHREEISMKCINIACMHVKKCETSNLSFSDVLTCVCFRCFIFLIIFSQEKVLMDMKSFVIKK